MGGVGLGWALLLLRAAAGAAALEASPVLTLGDGGRVQGWVRKGKNGKETTEFLGIPYAEPPIGELRFRAPVRKQRWPGILNATTPPNSCIQTEDTYFGDFFGADMWNANTPKSEDCLYLNVWYRLLLPLLPPLALPSSLGSSAGSREG